MIKKRLHMVVASLLVVSAFAFSAISFCLDSNRVEQGKPPFFIFRKDMLNDGGTVSYYGMGYQFICWKILGSQEGCYYYGVEKHYLFGMRDPLQDEPTVELALHDESDDGMGLI